MKCIALGRSIPGFVLLFTLFLSCSKHNTDAPLFTITGINPSVGPSGTEVTIMGSGFSSQIAGNIVKFNGVSAKIISATASAVVVEVPKFASTGRVTLEKDGKLITGPTFEYVLRVNAVFIAGKARGFVNGTDTTARFGFPTGIAVDGSGGILVADSGNFALRQISASGLVSTLAGGESGYKDGKGSAVKFNYPGGIAKNADRSEIYVSDVTNSRIRMIQTDGTVTTYAGNGPGYVDSVSADMAKFRGPTGIAADKAGNLFVSDTYNNVIRKISVDGFVSTIAGGVQGSDDGKGIGAQFNSPTGIALDEAGNIYVADTKNSRIRKITPAGLVTTFAGGRKGFRDGPGDIALFNTPTGLAVDKSGNVYVADWGNNLIRKITPDGVVTFLVTLKNGEKPGAGSNFNFNGAYALSIDADGNLLVAGTDGGIIQKITFE